MAPPRRCRTRRAAIALTPVFAAALLILAFAPPVPARGATDLQVRRDVPYGDHPRQVMDVYVPAAEDATGAGVVIVHGGGWRIGDKDDYTDEATAIAEAGLAVFNTNYRLERHTERPWPDELVDVQSAVRFVAGHAPVFGVDANRLALLGGSAGGQLAALVGTLGTGWDPAADPSPTDPVGTRVRAVATWSGLLDLTGLAPRNGARPADCEDDLQCLTVRDPQLISDYLGCTLDECPGTYATASPVQHVGPRSAQMFVVNSRDEVVPLAQPEAMLDRLVDAGVEHERLFLDGDRHSRAYADEALEPTIGFLRRALGADTGAGEENAAVPTVIAAVLIAALVGIALRERRRHDERLASAHDRFEERAS